jgi:hypothetical protein
MKRRLRTAPALALFVTLTARTGAQDNLSPAPPPANRIQALLATEPQKFGAIAAKPGAYRVQVLLGEIEERDGAPALAQTDWRADAEYFYPGDAIHLCAAVAALERLGDLARSLERPIDERCALAFHPSGKKGTLRRTDASNLEGGTITAAHTIRRALIASDQDAFNDLYELCGQKWLNERMWRAGIMSVRIPQRLGVGRSLTFNRDTPQFEIRVGDTPLLIPGSHSDLDLSLGDVGPSVFVGNAFADKNEVVPRPMSFWNKSRFGLRDMQICLARVVRPDLSFPGKTFDITEAQRALLSEALSQYPGDSKNPRYDRAEYPDEHAKPFLPGLARVAPKEALRVYSRCGIDLGFVVDNAYVVDTRSGRAFFLAAAIYANSDGVLNDDRYDYEVVGLPFMADLAELVARDVWKVAK